MSAYFVPTRFTWQFGGQVVSYLRGPAAHAKLTCEVNFDFAGPPVWLVHTMGGDCTHGF